DELSAAYPAERVYRHHAANSRNNLGYLLQRQGRAAEAEPLHREAAELFRKIQAEAPTSYADGLAMSYSGLSAVLASQGKFQEAEELTRQAVALYAKLIVSSPHDPWYKYKLA